MTIELLWNHLAQNPVLWLCLTLFAYQIGIWVYQKSGFITLLSPFVIAVAILLVILFATHTRYETFFAGAQFVHFLLGPATVALAVPLFDQRLRLAKLWAPLFIGVTVGCIVGVASTVLLGVLFHASFESIMSMAPKSVTTPIAMGISEKMGGIAEFTAGIVVLTGITGSLLAGIIFKLFGIKKDYIKGFALGVAAHGMGTSRAFQISDKAGAFSGLAMGLAGIVTAFVAPMLAPPLLNWLLNQ